VKTTKGKKMAKKERKPRKEPKPKKEPKAKEVKVRGPPKAPAVHQGFDPWKPDEADLPTPENNGWWGLKPVSQPTLLCMRTADFVSSAARVM
jgi:hypothetical protein